MLDQWRRGRRRRTRYNAAMDRNGLPRRLIALVAAYGLALQALFAVMVAVPPDAVSVVICSRDHAGAPDRQVPAVPRHGTGCALCPLTCAGATTLPSGAPAVVAIAPSRDVIPLPPVGAAVAHRVARAGFARAPPV